MAAACIARKTFKNHNNPDILSELTNIPTLPHAPAPSQEVLNIDYGVPVVHPADFPSALVVVGFTKRFVGQILLYDSD